jgi:hypothetical protein
MALFTAQDRANDVTGQRYSNSKAGLLHNPPAFKTAHQCHSHGREKAIITCVRLNTLVVSADESVPGFNIVIEKHGNHSKK